MACRSHSYEEGKEEGDSFEALKSIMKMRKKTRKRARKQLQEQERVLLDGILLHFNSGWDPRFLGDGKAFENAPSHPKYVL